MSENGIFDISTVGDGTQYQNFTHFTKIGSSVWQLVGTNSAFLPTVVSEVTLTVNNVLDATVEYSSGCSCLGAWFGATGELQGNRNASELTRRSSGFFIGVDKALGSAARVGLVGGHARYHITALQSVNRFDNYALGVY